MYDDVRRRDAFGISSCPLPRLGAHNGYAQRNHVQDADREVLVGREALYVVENKHISLTEAEAMEIDQLGWEVMGVGGMW